jgi:hypothetical protein
MGRRERNTRLRRRAIAPMGRLLREPFQHDPRGRRRIADEDSAVAAEIQALLHAEAAAERQAGREGGAESAEDAEFAAELQTILRAEARLLGQGGAGAAGEGGRAAEGGVGQPAGSRRDEAGRVDEVAEGEGWLPGSMPGGREAQLDADQWRRWQGHEEAPAEARRQDSIGDSTAYGAPQFDWQERKEQ